MSFDDSSTTAFTELKDNESTAHLPGISATATSSLASSINDKSSFPAISTAHPTATFPSTATRGAHSTKSAAGFESVTTDAQRFSSAWFSFYLQQTRVIVVLLLVAFFVSLVIAAYSIGHERVSSNNASSQCPAWGDIVGPDNVINKCPSGTVQVYYGYNAIVNHGDPLTRDNTNNQYGPLAVFLPGASSFYYYTLIIVDPDFPSHANPSSGPYLKGLVTNLRLSDSLDVRQRGATWLTSYETPNPPVSSGIHRFVFLLYRHSSPFSGDGGPTTRFRFKPESWVNSASWSGATPELIAANWFVIDSNRG